MGKVKQLDLLIRVMANINRYSDKLIVFVIGSGPEENMCKKLAKSLNVDNIKWIGQVKYEDVCGIMGGSDFLIHTSYREAASSVVMEALSKGLPIICHDVGGMSIAVNEKCGIKIPLKSYQNSIDGFSEGMEKLINNDKHLYDLKNGAINRSKEITWAKMTEDITNDYVASIKE